MLKNATFGNLILLLFSLIGLLEYIYLLPHYW